MSKTDSLESWLKDSIFSGCTLPAMVESMVASGHAENLALLIVSGAFARFKPDALELVRSSEGGEMTLQIFQHDEKSEPTQKNLSAAKVVPVLDPVAIESNTIALSDRVVTMLLAGVSPRMALFENVLSEDECAALIAASADKLERSRVVDNTRDNAFVDQARTSAGTYFEKNESALVNVIQQRIAELVQLPLENAEPLQILHYEVGGAYLPHFDYFDPTQDGATSPLQHGGQRIVTVIVYLNAVEKGGATVFPQLGLEIRPRQGSAVYFSYQLEDGSVDPASLHGGSPIVQGEKWIATQWFRAGAFR